MSVFSRRGRPSWKKAELEHVLKGAPGLERLLTVAVRPPQPPRESLPLLCTDPDCLHHLFAHDLRSPLLACTTGRCRCRSYSPART